MFTKPQRSALLLCGAVVSIALMATLVLRVSNDNIPSRKAQTPLVSDVGGTAVSLFTANYPANSKFQEELELLRKKGRLKAENEILIHRSVLSASQQLKMPPAVLWCLLFQESRLNHLEGIEGDRGARGLGQFSHFSFYEINHHLDKFKSGNTEMMMGILGRDIRPVEARQRDLKHPSSYFFIPTAVVTSAAFLNNRYHQLRRLLDRKSILYDREILWVYAAMAYNKGGRSVLSLWNDTRRRGGVRRLEKMLLESSTAFETVTDSKLLTRSLKKIWPAPTAVEFAKELEIHMKNMKSCSVTAEATLPGVSPFPDVKQN